MACCRFIGHIRLLPLIGVQCIVFAQNLHLICYQIVLLLFLYINLYLVFSVNVGYVLESWTYFTDTLRDWETIILIFSFASVWLFCSSVLLNFVSSSHFVILSFHLNEFFLLYKGPVCTKITPAVQQNRLIKFFKKIIKD
jgi:hypothetical protein